MVSSHLSLGEYPGSDISQNGDSKIAIKPSVRRISGHPESDFFTPYPFFSSAP